MTKKERPDEIEQEDEDVEQEDAISSAEKIMEIADDLEDGVYDDDVSPEIELLLDTVFALHQLLSNVYHMISAFTKKDRRIIDKSYPTLMEELEQAILLELSPLVCEECEAYLQRCLCDSSDENDEDEEEENEDDDE